MATTIRLKSRRNALQIQALKVVEVEVRASDQSWRRKYLRDYEQAFRAYESVLDSAQLERRIADASLILVGDYHALPACQQFLAKLLKDRARVEKATGKNRPVILGLEAIFSRDQHILDEWWRCEIDEHELRQRIRFDRDWGYEWDPFYELLSAARGHADAVYGLDCMPRDDLRKISTRDRHAAYKIAEIRERHPDAIIVTLIGESHLAPTHLPALVRKQLPRESVLTILQNVDALYWRVSEGHPETPAVRVNENTICVFNSTPLEKYENYRACLDRWSEEPQDELDFAPVVYSLIEGLSRFLDINRYSPRNGTQPKFLVDLLPEVCGQSMDQLRKLLAREHVAEETARTITKHVEERGCIYLPQSNAFFVRDFQMASAAKEAARFVHHACQGLPLTSAAPRVMQGEDIVYAEMLKNALAYVGSRILCEAGALQPGLNDCFSQARGNPLVERRRPCDTNFIVHEEGCELGAALYDAYVHGRLERPELKRIFLTPIREPRKAAELYSRIKARLGRRFPDREKAQESATSQALL